MDTNIKRKEDKEKCMFCSRWEYDEHIERRYGEGCGICRDGMHDGEICFCDKKACIMFIPR